jgi:hypothetical protein
MAFSLVAVAIGGFAMIGGHGGGPELMLVMPAMMLVVPALPAARRLLTRIRNRRRGIAATARRRQIYDYHQPLACADESR